MMILAKKLEESENSEAVNHCITFILILTFFINCFLFSIQWKHISIFIPLAWSFEFGQDEAILFCECIFYIVERRNEHLLNPQKKQIPIILLHIRKNSFLSLNIPSQEQCHTNQQALIVDIWVLNCTHKIADKIYAAEIN